MGARFAALGGVRPLRNLNAPTGVASAVRPRKRACCTDSRSGRQRARQGACRLDWRGAGYREDATCGRARGCGGDTTRNSRVGTLRRRGCGAAVLAMGRRHPGLAADGHPGRAPPARVVPRAYQRTGAGPDASSSDVDSVGCTDDCVRPLSAVRRRAHVAAARLLTRSVVLVLDDLHQADASSLLLLEFVARELSDSRLLLVATYRADEMSRRLMETMGELARVGLQKMVLTGFGLSATGQLLAHLVGKRLF